MGINLFGETEVDPPKVGARTTAEIRRDQRRLSEQAKGYAWRPGTGPADETCGTCKHPVRRSTGCRMVIKCGANRDAWTKSVRTDIRLRSPACKKWEAKPA